MKGGQTMPGFNKTGPSGRGPMTGRGRGVCNTAESASATGIHSEACIGFGMGFRRRLRGPFDLESRNYPSKGMGRNRRAVWMQMYPEDSPRVEIDRLKTQAESIKHKLDTINQRLSEMEKSQ